MRFNTIAFGHPNLCLVAALSGTMIAAATVVVPIPETARVNIAGLNPTAPSIMSHANMLRWLATTNADITFVGKPINPLADPTKLAADNVMVTFCSTVNGRNCEGPCTTYNGGASVCIHAPNTNCLGATTDVYFCASGNCDCNPGCNLYSSCGVALNNGYCYTPGTNSIVVPA